MNRSSRFGWLTNERVAALALALAPFVYFLPATRGDLVLCPDDCWLYYLPLRVAGAQLALDGQLPLWNPYLFSGMPLLGALQAGILYPLNWLFLILNAPAAMNLMVLATYALAGVGAYLYARRAGASVAGALVTGMVWQWSGFLVTQLGHLIIIQTASLLPWLLWAIDGYGQTGRRARGIVIALLVALMVFVGHPQSLVYALLLAAAYAIFMGWQESDVRRRYLSAGALLAAGLALGAAQLLPAWELLRRSLRVTDSYEFFTSFSLPPQFLLTFVAPYLYGGGDGQLFRAPYIGPPYYGEYGAYVGVAAFMLALLAPFIARDRRTLFWSGAALVCLALALGGFWPFDLYRLVYYVPVLNLFRAPARHLLEVNFALAVLAGRAVTALAVASERARAERAALYAGGIILAVTLLCVTLLRPGEFQSGRESSLSFGSAPELWLPVLFAAAGMWAIWRYARAGRYAAVLLVALLVADLAVWGQMSGWRLSPTSDGPLWQEPRVVSFLRERAGAAGQHRIITITPPVPPGVSHAISQLPLTETLVALQPDTYMMRGIENAAGYDGFGLARYSRLAGDMRLWGELADPQRSLSVSRELDLLNVRYLLAASSFDPLRANAGEEALAERLPATQILGGYRFAAQRLDIPELTAGARYAFAVPRAEADKIALVTSLAYGSSAPDGATVGRVRAQSADGREFEFPLRAGDETAEWAHERPDVRRQARHRLAPVAETWRVEGAEGSFAAHHFIAVFTLPARVALTRVEVEAVNVAEAPQLRLSLLRASLLDETQSEATPLRREWMRAATAPEADMTERAGAAGRWRRVAELGEVVVYENTRVLPRVWLATGAVSQTDEATLASIRTGRLADGRAWEPARTALLDVPLPQDYAGAEAPARAEIVRYEPHRIEIRTASDLPAVLVLSENHYPGWQASVDGQFAETLRVNYNLRGVFLPAGAHEVRFVYRPKSFLIGLLISCLTALALAGWHLAGRRGARRA